MIVCSQPACQTTAGCVCGKVDCRKVTEVEEALLQRVAHLEMLLRDVHDPLLISEALLRKHGHPATADMVKEAYDKVAALGTGPIQ